MKLQPRRKDLKRPDEFVSLGRQVLQWTQAHRREVGIAASVLFAFLVLVGALVTYQQRALEHANEELTAALGQYRAAKYPEAASELAAVAQRWQNRLPGKLAAVLAGHAALRVNEPNRTSELLANLVNDSNLPPPLRQAAALGVAYAHEAAGKLDEASTAFERAEQQGGPYTTVARYEQLRVAVQQGDANRARSLLESLKREDANSAELRRARVLLREP